MRQGKISQNQWRRSVGKKIQYQSENLVLKPAPGRDCSVYRQGEGTFICPTINSSSGPLPFLGKKAFYHMQNDLLAAGARPKGMMVQLLLPLSAEEKEIQSIMGQLGELAARYEVDICGGHTEVSELVTSPLLTLSGFGKQLVPDTGSHKLKPGQQIVMTKWAGAAGAAEMAYLHKEELIRYFPKIFVEEAVDYLYEEVEGSSLLSGEREVEIALASGVRAFHNISHNGIYGALWEMAEASGTGLRIDGGAIPIRQESIEICERYEKNPYQIDSQGSMLMGTDHGEELVARLRDHQIFAEIIGCATEGKDRVICQGEETRYLTPP